MTTKRKKAPDVKAHAFRPEVIGTRFSLRVENGKAIRRPGAGRGLMAGPVEVVRPVATILVCLIALAGSLSGSFAQEVNQTKPPDPQAVPTAPKDATAQETQGATPTGDEAKKADEKPHEKDALVRGITERGSIVVAPLPISSPAIGTGIIPALGYIFPLDKNDKISPPSVIGGAGLITNNGSSGFGLGAELFFKEDTYRFDAVYANGNINYNLYGVGGIAGHQGLRLPIGQQGNVFLGEFLRRIAWKFFLGARFWSGDSAVTIRPTTEDRVPPPLMLGYTRRFGRSDYG